MPGGGTEGVSHKGGHIGVTLNLLGGFSAEIQAGSPIALPKKAQAVLALLVIDRGKPVARDFIANLLWSDTTSEQARHSLRQSLSVLRRALHPFFEGCLVSRSESLTLLPDSRLASDVEAFERLAKSKSPEDQAHADSLYRGDFLAGLSLPSEPYEEWITTERQRLLALRLRVLETRIDLLVEANEITHAIDVAKRLTELDPFAEDSSRRLMRLLVVGGRRVQALAEFARLERVLREELQTAPDAPTRELAESLRQGAGNGASAATPTGNVAPQTAAHFIAWDRPTISIRPFASLYEGSRNGQLARAVTEDIAATLVRERWPVVVIDPVIGHLGSSLRSSAPDSRYVLSGSIRQDGRRVRVAVRLTEAASGRDLWSDRLDATDIDQFALHDRLSARIVARLAPAIRMLEGDRVARKPIESMTAHELYVHAVAVCRQGRAGNARALALLRRANELDPELAVAYALAARCFHLQRLMGWSPPGDPQLYTGVRLAHRAIELGGRDPEALWLAGLALANIDGNPDEGQRLVDLSLSINPNNASAWIGSCFVRAHSGDTATALEHFQQAQIVNAEDSAQHVQWHAAAMAHFVAGEYEAADAATDKALRQSPDYPGALRMRVSTAGLLGRIDKAHLAAQRLLKANPDASVDSMRQYWRPWMRYTPHALAAMVEGWRNAKMPEG
jgi:DNA-binding SARP family transcriptional activator